MRPSESERAAPSEGGQEGPLSGLPAPASAISLSWFQLPLALQHLLVRSINDTSSWPRAAKHGPAWMGQKVPSGFARHNALSHCPSVPLQRDLPQSDSLQRPV